MLTHQRLSRILYGSNAYHTYPKGLIGAQVTAPHQMANASNSNGLVFFGASQLVSRWQGLILSAKLRRLPKGHPDRRGMVALHQRRSEGQDVDASVRLVIVAQRP
jgi:hypothetical protein